MKIAGGALAALVIGQAAIAQSSASWTCREGQRWTCNSIGGCDWFESSEMTLEFDLAEPRYSRCDAAGCDDYTPVVTQSGFYTNIELTGRAAFTRINMEGVFVEVVTLGDQVLIMRGLCQRFPDGKSLKPR